MVGGTTTYQYHLVRRDGAEDDAGHVPNEGAVTIFINGQELATLMCTPTTPKALALGFLLNEGIVNAREDVQVARTCQAGGCVDIWLSYSLPSLPKRRILTTGCVGGVTFEELRAEAPPLQSKLTVTAAQLWDLMTQLYAAGELHKLSGGIHTSAFAKDDKVLLVSEDVGRHNTLDKLRGLAFLEDIDMQDGILLTTGRISSEMLNKARHMRVPVVVSRTSPTALSVTMARAWDIMLIGYIRRDRMTIYANPWRLASV